MQIDQNKTHEIRQDLPREKSTNKSSSNKNYFSRIHFAEENDFLGGPQKRQGFKLALWTIASVAADHLIILGTTLLFIFIGTLTLQLGFKTMVSFKMLGESLVPLYLGISMIYFVLFRVFLAATLGEYSCGLRLGQPLQRIQKNYSLKIILRTLLIIFTGIVTLPILSLIFKKDIAGRLCGVSIYSLK
jgi:hypothetical protein